MSLLERLQGAYAQTKNYENKSFIPCQTARKLVTVDQIELWSQNNPLCRQHKFDGSHRTDLIRTVRRSNLLIFVVLVFSHMEFLFCQLIESGSTDMMLFHTEFFEKICQLANLSAEQKQGLAKYRKYVGVIFENSGVQDVSEDCVLPFYKRDDLRKAGASGVLYKVEIPGLHLLHHKDTSFYAEKRIRQDSEPVQDKSRLFREVHTLQSAKHPNIIRLLAAFTSETKESGYLVNSLHLIFPLAEMDLAHWMTADQIPSNVESFSRQQRQKYIYRSIYGLVSGISYLHREVEGTIITHHDLKPLNILVVDGTLKIADFGHSHLRPVIQGSATEGVAGLGTYEYQPPEYYDQDGKRAQCKYGRAFDVWAMGCIIIELATLIVDDWQSGMIHEFREKRKNNSIRERKSPVHVDQNSDASFHNNPIIVQSWVSRLNQLGDSQQMTEVLNIAYEMIAAEPRNRTYMWESHMDLQKTLKHYDELIPGLEEDLCIPPPLGREVSITYFGRTQPDLTFVRESVRWNSETPLHRAVKKNDRTRAIRLWELGWPLSLPDQDGETSLGIMARSEIMELQKLEAGVIAMIHAARIGNLEAIKNLFSRGLTASMVNADGRSAMFEAVKYSQIHVIDLLLETKEKEQLMLLDRTENMFPLHKAAEIGSMEALERLIRHYPNVNISAREVNGATADTALYYAAKGSHSDAVRLLIQNKALLLPPGGLRNWPETPLHAAIKPSHRSEVNETVKLLLKADDYSECVNLRGPWDRTPLMFAAYCGNTECCEILIKAGASVHGDPSKIENLLNIIAEHGLVNILQRYINYFSPEDFEICNGREETPLKEAQRMGHKEVSRLLKSRLAQFSQSGRSESSGSSAIFQSLKGVFKYR